MGVQAFESKVKPAFKDQATEMEPAEEPATVEVPEEELKLVDASCQYSE